MMHEKERIAIDCRDPADEFEKKELALILMDELRKIDPRLADAVTMRTVRGARFEVIGRELGVSLPRARAMVDAGLRKMRGIAARRGFG